MSAAVVKCPNCEYFMVQTGKYQWACVNDRCGHRVGQADRTKEASVPKSFDLEEGFDESLEAPRLPPSSPEAPLEVWDSNEPLPELNIEDIAEVEEERAVPSEPEFRPGLRPPPRLWKPPTFGKIYKVYLGEKQPSYNDIKDRWLGENRPTFDDITRTWLGRPKKTERD
jgi:hypothetical protein